MNNGMGAASGDSPLKNWGGSNKDFNWFAFRKLEPDKVTRRETKKYHCYSCIIGCGGICDIKGIGNGEFTQTHKPEYENLLFVWGLALKQKSGYHFLHQRTAQPGRDGQHLRRSNGGICH